MTTIREGHLFKIQHFEKLGGRTDIMQFFVDGWYELHAAGMMDADEQPIQWDNEVLVYRSLDRIVGALSYKYQDWNNAMYVVFGYVAKDFRRKGIYKMLWAELVERAYAKDCTKIGGLTSVKNTEMRAVAKAMGRREYAVSLLYDLPARKQAKSKDTIAVA